MILLVNFGSSKTGLATVGYTLYNSSGTEVQARTTTGVVEHVAGTYFADISLPANSKIITWDTGEGSPVYVSESLDGNVTHIHGEVADQGEGVNVTHVNGEAATQLTPPIEANLTQINGDAVTQGLGVNVDSMDSTVIDEIAAATGSSSSALELHAS